MLLKQRYTLYICVCVCDSGTPVVSNGEELCLMGKMQCIHLSLMLKKININLDDAEGNNLSAVVCFQGRILCHLLCLQQHHLHCDTAPEWCSHAAPMLLALHR